jgi:hypothetical protein
MLPSDVTGAAGDEAMPASPCVPCGDAAQTLLAYSRQAPRLKSSRWR